MKKLAIKIFVLLLICALTLPQTAWAAQLLIPGGQVIGMALEDDSVSISDPRLKAAPRLAVVLGTEGEGLEQATIDQCDYTVMIPMYHGVDSLNVAAASAVAFWELGRNPPCPCGASPL